MTVLGGSEVPTGSWCGLLAWVALSVDAVSCLMFYILVLSGSGGMLGTRS